MGTAGITGITVGAIGVLGTQTQAIVDELRDGVINTPLDHILTIFKSASGLAICLIPTFTIILITYTLTTIKRNKKLAEEHRKRQEIFESDEKMLTLVGEPASKPNSKLAYTSLSLTFGIDGKIIDTRQPVRRANENKVRA